MVPHLPSKVAFCSRCLPQGPSQSLVPNPSGSLGRRLLHRARYPRHEGPLPLLPPFLPPWRQQQQQQQAGSLPLLPPQARRGKRTKTVITLQDLPQGPIANQPGEADDCQHEVEPGKGQRIGPKYPAVLQQARENMDRLDNCVLLTRVGGFYELYFEHAQEYGPLLNLKVAYKKTNVGPILMAGFPYFQLDRFLKILVQDLTCSVAIAEEFPNDAADKIRSGGLMHTRKVSRIVTPGTLIDENFIDPNACNYVLSIRLSGLGGSMSESRFTSAFEACKAPFIRQLEQDHEPSLLHGPLQHSTVGIAWMDLSTGKFYLQSCPLPSLPAALSRIGPREVVLDRALELQDSHMLAKLLRQDQYLISYCPDGFHGYRPSRWEEMLESPVSKEVLGCMTAVEVDAANLLLYYVKDRLRGASMKLQPPVRCEKTHILAMDKNTMRSLEIKQTMRDGTFRGSLLHTIRRTVTKGGARLLNEWLSSPSTSLQVVSKRQDLVEAFLCDSKLRNSLIHLLKKSHDSQRLVQKFALGRGDAEDLLSLASTIHATAEMQKLLDDAVPVTSRDGDEEVPGPQPGLSKCLRSLSSRLSLKGPLRLAGRIRNAIDKAGLATQQQLQNEEAGAFLALAEEVVANHGNTEDATAILPKSSEVLAACADQTTTRGRTKEKKREVAAGAAASWRQVYGDGSEVWVMKPSASPALARLHGELDDLHIERDTLEKTLRGQLNAPSLTLKWTPGLGHICHIKGKDAKSLKFLPEMGDGIVVVSSSRSTRSLHIPQWTALGYKVDQLCARIRAEESSVFSQLRQAVIRNLVALRRNAAVLEEMDVTVGFAVLAEERNLVRPKLCDDGTVGHNVVGGRHPTVEKGLDDQGRSFISNDCFVGSKDGKYGRAWLITGPNMAGKSTFLRQNALLTVLAQIGCFVPADFVEMAIVDAIFSRVGSADNLYHDQSTFMVEMVETAAILQCATDRSFVIMDEVGRGTSPDEGVAIAYACLNHLTTVNKCRLLFATHFHQLADIVIGAKLDVASGGPVNMYCTDVEEADSMGRFVYVYRLKQGVNRRSHALSVARLAGLPQTAIDIASRIMNAQSGHKLHNDG